MYILYIIPVGFRLRQNFRFYNQFNLSEAITFVKYEIVWQIESMG